MAGLFDDQVREWQERAARFRHLAALYRGDEEGDRLLAVATDIEQQVKRFAQIRAVADERRRQRSILLTELDLLIARSRGGMFFSTRRLRPTYANAADLQDMDRLSDDRIVVDIDAIRFRRYVRFFVVGRSQARLQLMSRDGADADVDQVGIRIAPCR